MTEPASDTVFDRLLASLRARAAPLDGQARPAAVLWTDPGREWEPLVDLLLARVEETLVLGDYRPERRTGPAVWLRCVVDGALDEPALPGGRPPVVYLPGVARQDLRAGADCPDRLKPLVELLFRGALWHHPNGGDWTVNAFLASPRTLGLDVAGDRGTAAALSRALEEVALTPVAQLAGRRLEADDFDRMLAGDVVRDLLRWMGDPDAVRSRLGENGWHAFCSRCREELGFDPAREADVAAGERMAAGEGAWAAVWERFAEAPGGYGDVAGLLRRSAPADALRFDARERWPDLNEGDEEAVRDALRELPGLAHDAACEAVAGLERSHGRRRAWVWARLGQAPMAEVLEPLARLAAGARRALGGTEPADVAAAYRERGWQADLGAWRAVAAAPAADEDCVAAAVRHLLSPWLEESARAFQAAVERRPLPGAAGRPGAGAGSGGRGAAAGFGGRPDSDEPPGGRPRRGAENDDSAGVGGRPDTGADSVPPVDVEDGGCLVFVDGLRFDLAQGLAERLEGRGFRVDLGWRWAALPTVTGTGETGGDAGGRRDRGRRAGAGFRPADEGRRPAGRCVRAARRAGRARLPDAGRRPERRRRPGRGSRPGRRRAARLARDGRVRHPRTPAGRAAGA